MLIGVSLLPITFLLIHSNAANSAECLGRNRSGLIKQVVGMSLMHITFPIVLETAGSTEIGRKLSIVPGLLFEERNDISCF